MKPHYDSAQVGRTVRHRSLKIMEGTKKKHDFDCEHTNQVLSTQDTATCVQRWGIYKGELTHFTVTIVNNVMVFYLNGVQVDFMWPNAIITGRGDAN